MAKPNVDEDPKSRGATWRIHGAQYFAAKFIRNIFTYCDERERERGTARNEREISIRVQRVDPSASRFLVQESRCGASRRGAVRFWVIRFRAGGRKGKKGGKKIREKVLFTRSNTETPISPEAQRGELREFPRNFLPHYRITNCIRDNVDTILPTIGNFANFARSSPCKMQILD